MSDLGTALSVLRAILQYEPMERLEAFAEDPSLWEYVEAVVAALERDG